MFIRKLKITHKIMGIIATGIIISMSFAILAVTFGQKQSNTYLEQITPLDNFRKIQLIFRELEFRMAGVMSEIVTPNAAATDLEYSLKQIDSLWNQLDTLTPDGEDKAKFKKGLIDFKGMSGRLINAYSNEDSIEELYDEWLDYKPLILKTIDRLAEEKKNEVNLYYENNNKFVSLISKIIVIVSIIALCMFITFAVLMTRTINRPIRKIIEGAGLVAQGDLTHIIRVNTEDEMGQIASVLNNMITHLRESFSRIVMAVEKMSGNTDGLSSLSKKLLNGAKDQNEKGDQVAAASAEMSQTIIDMAKNTEEVSGATKESYDSAKDGREIVGETVESINKLAARVGDASGKIEGLGRHMEEIGVIVSVIQDIADQTNLLALNAAIEAARSGEHGRGFAVVADEVRKLAERTAHATDEIDGKITAIQSESRISIDIMEKGRELADELVSRANKAGDALQEIVESSDRVMDMVQRLSAATEEQSSASEQVSQNMEYISEIIKEHYKLAEEAEKSASDLSSIAQEVTEQTSYFKTEERGGNDINKTTSSPSSYGEPRGSAMHKLGNAPL